MILCTIFGYIGLSVATGVILKQLRENNLSLKVNLLLGLAWPVFLGIVLYKIGSYVVLVVPGLIRMKRAERKKAKTS
jgi:hypothetical protein